MQLKLHPTFTHASLLTEICKPLEHFNINCFGYVHVNNVHEMTYLRNQPCFTEIYHAKNYYLNDIYSAQENFGEFVLWNSLSCSGKANDMIYETAQAGFHQFFSIIEKKHNDTHFYHFATSISDKDMSQTYLNNIDALKAFIAYFKNTVANTKELAPWTNFKFKLEEQKHTNILLSTNQVNSLDNTRKAFFQDIHNDDMNIVLLSKQQKRCVDLLLQGYAPKQIAIEMQLTPKTIEHYFTAIRTKYQCKTMRELILKLK